jgi:hypothetical protein
MTPLWKRVAADYRYLGLPVIVVLVLNLVAYLAVVQPRGAKAAGAADRAARAAEAVRAAVRAETLARALVTGKAQADEELARFYRDVLPTNLTAANRMTYASLPALARRTNVRFQGRTSELDESIKDDLLGHLRIRMVLEGDYANLRTFVYQLETAPDFVIIDDVTLTEARTTEQLTLVVNLSTYFKKRSDAD